MKGAAPYLMLAGGIGGAAFHAHFATTMDNPALWPFAVLCLVGGVCGFFSLVWDRLER